jgi:signal transduction histidine kinase
MLHNRSHQWIFYFAAGFVYLSVLLRALLTYQGSSILGWILSLLAAWLILFAGEMSLRGKSQRYFGIYLALQTILVGVLLYIPEYPGSDFLALLFVVLSMQAAQRLSTRVAIVWLGLFTLVIASVFLDVFGIAQGSGYVLLYTAINILMASYSQATRRAHEMSLRNQALAAEVQSANQQLQAYTVRLERLATAREHQRLGRELHDSVTQTMFSMNLTTQSALLLFERDPRQVPAQLERLGELAHSALSEIQLLISELHPAKYSAGGLAAALRQLALDRRFAGQLSISLEIQGDGRLNLAEEQALLGIVHEALTNVVKHAQTSQACLRAHLSEPFWIEVEDLGKGFVLQQASREGVGLNGMRERAVEIGWNLQIKSATGAGTSVRVEKLLPEGGQHDNPGSEN